MGLTNKSQFTKSHCWAPPRELEDDLPTYAVIFINANFLFSFSPPLQDKTADTNPSCRLIHVCAERSLSDGCSGDICTTSLLKMVTSRKIDPDSIVSALAEAMNQAELHHQRESGIGRGTIKNTEPTTTTNFSNQCTFSWRQGEINSRLEGYCKGRFTGEQGLLTNTLYPQVNEDGEKKGWKRRSEGRKERDSLKNETEGEKS